MQVVNELHKVDKNLKPLKELPPQIAVFYDSVHDDFDKTMLISNSMCYLKNDVFVKLCGSDELAPRIQLSHLK